jgi:hypothetical protein
MNLLRTAVVAVLVQTCVAGNLQGQQSTSSSADTESKATEANRSGQNTLDRPMSELTIDIAPPAQLLRSEASDQSPIVNHAAEYFQTLEARESSRRVGRPGMLRPFCWAAPGFYHQPLYFEQINVERYGHHVCCGPCSDCAQSVVSAAHFFAAMPLLPYKIGADPCCERQYTLGHYRPGSCNPHQLHFVRPSGNGLTCEAMVITGLIFLIP